MDSASGSSSTAAEPDDQPRAVPNGLPEGSAGIVDVDLADPLPHLVAPGGPGPVRVLVRLHSYPVAQVAVPVSGAGLTPDELAAALAGALPAVNAHLERDRLPAVTAISPGGLGGAGAPPCLARRRQLVADGPAMTVLIATRDRTEALLRCLRSIAAIEHPRFDVVVVDSAPASDETRDAVAALNGRVGTAPLRYVREDRPGVALAHNRGLAEVTGSWVAITDDDVVVDRHWLAAIVEARAAAPGTGCVTGLIMPAELETAAQELLEQYGGYSRGFVRRAYDLGEHRPPDPLFPYTVGRLGSGANMAFETALLRERGGFDPATGIGTRARGGDDLLGLLRVLTAGRGVVYEPASLVWHWHRRDYSSLRTLVHNYGVGLGAYLTSALVHEPRLLPDMARRALPGARHAFSRASGKNQAKGPAFPRELEIAEWTGFLQGPFAYAASRWAHRRAGR